MTGQWYENGGSYEDYIISSFETSVLFQALQENQYKMGIYDPELALDYSHFNGMFCNTFAQQYEFSTLWNFRRCLLKMANIKFAPYSVKKHSYDLPEAVEDLKIIRDNDEYDVFRYYNYIFHGDTVDKKSTVTADKVFKWLHLSGGHVPYEYSSDGTLLKEGETGTYEQNVDAATVMIEDLLNILKRLGVYDNSIIVILSDHGYREDEDKSTQCYGRQHPILMVKGFQEKHDFQISHAPISYDDMMTAYQRLLQGNPGGDIFDAREGQSRERRYLLYHFPDYSVLTEYIQYGKAHDTSAMKLTGRVYERPR